MASLKIFGSPTDGILLRRRSTRKAITRASLAQDPQEERTLAQLEERTFYPAARSGLTHVVLRRLGEGHRRMRALQASLLALEVGDPEFQGGLDALRAQFRRHKDLEPALFALAREQLGAERLGALGADLEQVLRELEPPEAVTGEAESPRA